MAKDSEPQARAKVVSQPEADGGHPRATVGFLFHQQDDARHDKD